MGDRSTLQYAACALVVALIGFPIATAQAQTLDFNQAANRGVRAPIEEVIADAPRMHAVAMFYLARRLFELERRDEALFWFYEGQLRWRAYLMQTPNGSGQARQGGLFGGGERSRYQQLFDTIGPDINAYAFCDMQAFSRMVDAVIAWDNEHPDAFATDAVTKAQAQQGLRDLIEYAQEHSAELDARRQETCSAPGADPYATSGGAIGGRPPEMLANYNPEQFAALQVGVTTRDEVLRVLGRPEWWAVDESGATFGYSYNRPLGAPLSGMLIEQVRVSFRFDSGRVLREVLLPRDREH